LGTISTLDPRASAYAITLQGTG